MISYIIAAICFVFALLLLIAARPTPGGVDTNVILVVPAAIFGLVGIMILGIHWL